MLWMPGAERRPQSNGGSMVGGPPRAVWHITWDELGPGGRMPSFDAISNYLVNVGYAPHLMWDPWTGRIVQYYPADESARALAHPGGTAETNRMGDRCIQVEVFFSPGAVVGGKRYATVADTPCKGLDRIVAWMRTHGIPDRWPSGWPDWDGNSRSLSTWTTKAGHFGHCNVPANDHSDPGPMPRSMFTGAAAEPAPSEEDEMLNGELNNGPKAVTAVSFPSGKAGAIGFICDNGIQQLPPAKLRVAVHDVKAGWDVQHVTVDSAKGKTVVHFPRASTDGLSIQREDNGDVNVAWDAS